MLYNELEDIDDENLLHLFELHYVKKSFGHLLYRYCRADFIIIEKDFLSIKYTIR